MESLEGNPSKKPNPMAQQQKMGANPMGPMMMPGMNMGGQQPDQNQKIK